MTCLPDTRDPDWGSVGTAEELKEYMGPRQEEYVLHSEGPRTIPEGKGASANQRAS